MIFKNVKTGKVDQYNPDDVERINWLIRAKGYCLKFMLASGTIHRYDGFRDAVSSNEHIQASRVYSYQAHRAKRVPDNGENKCFQFLSSEYFFFDPHIARS